VTGRAEGVSRLTIVIARHLRSIFVSFIYHPRSPENLSSGRMNQTTNTNTILPVYDKTQRYLAPNPRTDSTSTVPPRTLKESFVYLLRVLMVEYVCTLLFIFFVLGGAVEAQRFGPADYAANVVVALAQGFALLAFISAAASTSGGHLNPAVTVGAFIAGCIKWWKAILYIIVQIAAGITAAALLKGVLPHQHRDKLGATTPGSDESRARAYLFESVMTFALVLVVLATTVCPIKRTGAVGRLAALPIGLTLSAALLISWPYTGTSLNPARSFGPAVVNGTWTGEWIYWVGPFTGGIFAGIFHRLVVLPASTEPSRDACRTRAEPSGDKCPAPGNACS